MVFVIIVAKLVANKFYKARAIFTVFDLGFTVSWTENFSVFSESDYNFTFENLQEYVFEPWGEKYRLKVKTKEGKTVKFLFKQGKNDEVNFTAFCDNLQNSINIYNSKDTDPTNDLKVGGTFWESKTAQITVVILTALLVWVWTRTLSGEANVKPVKLVLFSVLAILLTVRIVYAFLKRIKEK